MSRLQKKNVLVVGATSAIAQATSRRLAERNASMVLVGRNKSKLDDIAGDLTVRGGDVKDIVIADLGDFETHGEIMERSRSAFDNAIDMALYAHGLNGVQQEAQQDYAKAEEIIRINYLSVVSMLTDMANYMEERKQGSIVAISSVAGDRGRQSNYVYGSAKGALSIYMQGLRNRLHPAGVQVLTVKPGFVDTPMTADMEKNRLFVGPEVIAQGICRAVEKKRNQVYLPWYWYGIMALIKSIPEELFKRMKL